LAINIFCLGGWPLAARVRVAHERTMKTHRAIAAGLLCSMLLAACGSSDLTWTEDVKLPDGRVITLKRWVEFKGGSSHLGDPSTESRQSLEFKHPDTGEIVKWRNQMPQGPFRIDLSSSVPASFDTGPDNMAPGTLNTIALWLEQGKPRLLAKPMYGGDFSRFYCPNPPYLLYEYSAGQWRNRPLAEIGIKRVRANLTASPINSREDIELNKRHLTAAQTADSYTRPTGTYQVPYLIQFEGMPAQTFGLQNCSRPFNKLLTEGK
jgi:hypothetical protein